MTRKTQLFYRGRAVRLQQSWPDGTALVQFLDHGHVAVVSANEVSSVSRPSLADTQETDADPEHNVSPKKSPCPRCGTVHHPGYSCPPQERSVVMFDRLFTMPKFGHDWR
jgi:hypothetical protein